MSDQLSKVDRALSCGCVVCICEDDERCHGCGAKCCERGPHGIESAAPVEVELPEPALHYHDGVGLVPAYTVEQVAPLASQLAEAKAENERLQGLNSQLVKKSNTQVIELARLEEVLAAATRRVAEVDDAMVERAAIAIHDCGRNRTFRGPWEGYFPDYQNKIRDQAIAALKAALQKEPK